MVVAAGLGALSPTVASAADAKPVDFNRDVLPILSDYCFTCHGPDANKCDAGLSPTPSGSLL